MASSLLSPSPSSLNLKDQLHLNSILALISLVDRHIHHLLSDPLARKSLNRQCTTTHDNSSDILSNLNLAIKSLENAIQSETSDEKAEHLASSEKMLQFPASLDEDGSTYGIVNRYIVSCAYFYLSLVRKLRGDECQMTMHFLQSLLASPGAVKTKFAPELWKSLFRPLVTDEAARKQARRFKDWLMYYQVVSYGEGMKNFQYKSFGSRRFECDIKLAILPQDKMVDKLDHQQDDASEQKKVVPRPTSEEHESSTEPKDGKALVKYLDEDFDDSFNFRCLQDMLEDSQSELHADFDDMSISEVREASEDRVKVSPEDADILPPNLSGRYIPESSIPDTPVYRMQHEACRTNASFLTSSRLHSSSNFNISILDLRGTEAYSFSNCNVEEYISPGRQSTQGVRCFRNFSSKFLKKNNLLELVPRGNSARKRINVSNSERDWSEVSSGFEKESQVELLGKFEKAVSTLRTTECLGYGKDTDLEVTTLWELVSNKKKAKYGSVNQEILDQLMDIISTSRKEKVIRASVSILLVLISEDRTIIEGIKRKDLHLYYLASALKKNVHEAAIIIYMLNPSPSQIRNLELLPALVEAACNSNNHKEGSISLPLTPTSASIAMIEILVTAFDYVTNNMHLATISSPQVLSKFVNVAMNSNLEEGITLTAIFVRCMRLNGNCKKFLSQITPVDPFLHLLRSKESRANSAALEYFYEILRIPRASAVRLLHQIQAKGGINIISTLKVCLEQAELQHQLLAANLLLQLEMLDKSNARKMFREEVMQILLRTIESEDNPTAQSLSAFILSNLGGTYAWTGEPYTSAWLAKKTGLTSAYHKNMFRNIDWFDPCLQDPEIYAWSSKAARGVFKFGPSVFISLAKGIQSKTRSVRRECLIAIAWLGSELTILSRSELRYSACETLLSELAAFLHPGSELDERVLACLCVYNYTSGKGKQKLLDFSEGLRESLRRLSSVTWMAEELLKVTEYLLPTQPRISCVHTQILEIGQVGNGAATALIFYKGHLCAGYSDGFIKVWDIKGQRSILVCEVKEHKRAVSCFALSEPGDSLLSGSLDKTIKVWKIINRKLVSVEVIEMKEPVKELNSFGEKILVATPSRGLKVCDPSRKIQNIYRNKHVKSLDIAQGKCYIGCTDSSIQEVDMIEDHMIEIRAPQSSWRVKNKPINSVVVYKGWVYCAGAAVEGSSIKEWRRHRRPQISIKMTRGTKVQAMTVVEDFIYINCSSSPSIIQIWLRERQQKLGRLSAGSKITSLLTANDIILCGSESGLIKGWIPL